jgi:pimeloyl-ACP methyl ester carboxylesterase
MRIILAFALSLFFSLYTFSQKQKTNVYLFPGQGSDYRIFEKITLDSNYVIKRHITYPIPAKKTTLKEYAKIISAQIDTTKPFILIGVSLGGMLCVEIAEFLRPIKTIIISSAKCRNELPRRYKFQKAIPLNKATPAFMIKGGAKILQPIVEPDRNKNKDTFKKMLRAKNRKYLKRTVNMIINWERTTYSNKIIHIHGDNDHTIPIKNVKVNYVIKNGSHMMMLTKGEEINKLLIEILSVK